MVILQMGMERQASLRTLWSPLRFHRRKDEPLQTNNEYCEQSTVPGKLILFQLTRKTVDHTVGLYWYR